MKTEELARGTDRAERETFVIAKTVDGYRVCSALAPADQYLVAGTGADLVCSCPDFQRHANEPEWRCRHILAVLNHEHREGVSTTPHAAPAAPPATRAMVPQPASHVLGNGGQMLLKRSVSPDGRIDSLSVEFACPVDRVSDLEIRRQAQHTLQLQSAIVSGFLRRDEAPAPETTEGNGAVPAQLLGIAGMNTRFGRRLCLNVLVNGQVCKMFGAPQQLAEALCSVGCNVAVGEIAEGTQFNLPCRAATKPSPDGKYVNVERILPPAHRGGKV